MEAVKKLVELLGGVSRAARLAGVKPPTVHQWVRGSRPIPVASVPLLEQAVRCAVRRWDLRPSDWHLIWPELVGTEGAPPAPQQQVAQPPAPGEAAVDSETAHAS